MQVGRCLNGEGENKRDRDTKEKANKKWKKQNSEGKH